MGDRGTEKKGPSDASQGYWKTRILIAVHHTSIQPVEKSKIKFSFSVKLSSQIVSLLCTKSQKQNPSV